MMFELTELSADKQLSIDFAHGSPVRPQGLRLKARGGVIELNDQVLEDIVLWHENAPRTIIARLHPKESDVPMNLRVWNAWRDPAGTMQAWVGNSGIIVEERGDMIVLHCSDGFDEPNFDDLVVALELMPMRPASPSSFAVDH